jgi:RAB protein geranylgeranyltransferase component A
MMQQVAKLLSLKSKLEDNQVISVYSCMILNIDIYISMVSAAHAVCAKGLFIAMISTTVETNNPELEIKPALDLLGPVLEMFTQVTSLYEPLDDGTQD